MLENCIYWFAVICDNAISTYQAERSIYRIPRVFTTDILELDDESVESSQELVIFLNLAQTISNVDKLQNAECFIAEKTKVGIIPHQDFK